MLKNSTQKYGLITKLFHWGIALAFFWQFYLVYVHEWMSDEDPRSLQYILLHKSMGITIFVVAIFFIISRFLQAHPPLPNTMTAWQKSLARITHFLLFFVMLVMPASGYLMSMSKSRLVSWFGVIDLPRLSQNKALGSFFYNFHVYTSYFVIFIVALHIFATFYHHYFLKDKLLSRML